MSSTTTQHATLTYNDTEVQIPVKIGTMGEVGLDIAKLRKSTGLITYDNGYGSTGSCASEVTFIHGEEGVLLYRGYPIEELAEKADFIEVCYLLFHGELPKENELEAFRNAITHHSLIHEEMKKLYEGYPSTAHPMAVLSAMVSSLSAYYKPEDLAQTDLCIVRMLAKLKTIIAFAHKKAIGQPFIYPRNDLSYTADFLHMMHAVPSEEYVPDPVHVEALNMLLVLHADHEQNCSTSTVRMVGSSNANLFASIASGINALWGPLHGGANQRVIQMLETIYQDGADYKKYVDKAKSKEDPFRLMGFGHRVYKNFDPRARILKSTADKVLAKLGIDDPLLDIAKQLEEVALSDDYFISRNLYPNVDFYSGILYRAMGIPTEMFTVMFALGRLPGWIAQWREQRLDPSRRIYRPRQIYTGHPKRSYVSLSQR